MSLVFSLLQKDYVLLAADNRHTRGDQTGTYKNDGGIKTLEILGGYGVLGFAGQDFGEQIVFPAKQEGLLDNSQSLSEAAVKLSCFAQAKYLTLPDQQSKPVVQLLLAGFTTDLYGQPVATSYFLQSPAFGPCIKTYPYCYFDIIGKSHHGALYGLHRFGNHDLTPEAALRLSALVLLEICECDLTTGGDPQLYVIRRGKKSEKQNTEQVQALAIWARGIGAQLEHELVLRRD